MRVDPAGQHGQPAQVVGDGCGLGIDRGNLRAFDDNARIVQHVAPTIEHGACGNHNVFDWLR